MPSMPTYRAGKGSQFGLLDRQFGGDKSNYMAAYDAALARIDDPLGNLANAHSPADLTAKDVEHFKKHWLEDKDDWWPEGLHVEELLRAGYAEAIRRARTLELPIESLWICAEEPAPVFQVYIVEGPRQVTVLVYTPKPKEHVPPDTLTQGEPIWVVEVKDKDDKGQPRVVKKIKRGDEEVEIIARQIRYAP
jgi:hypothetical protein